MRCPQDQATWLHRTVDEHVPAARLIYPRRFKRGMFLRSLDEHLQVLYYLLQRTFQKDLSADTLTIIITIYVCYSLG